MPWKYSQSRGQLTWNGQVISVGYSGRGPGRNNPQMEHLRNTGPIPRGQYGIGPARTHATKGPVTMALTPVGHTARGRTAFLIHGDSRNHPGDASEGCIILSLDVRRRISVSGDTTLQVVE